MKRHGNLFNEIVTMDNLREAHRKASKGKGHYKEVVEVNAHEDFYLQQLQAQLISGAYQTSEYRVMERVEGGKLRIIHALPYFPDRIVHHAVMQIVGGIWKRSLIRDTFQSLEGRGTSDARRRVQKAIRGGKPTYYLQMDVKKFYPSVTQDVSKACVRRHIKCPRTLALLDNIIESVEGLPIGNYISQILGNMVLSTVDWYAKQNLKAEYYFRYCDDLIVLGSCKKWLRSAQRRIERQVNKLGLTIKPSWIIQSLDSNGLDFCGYVFFSDRIRLRAAIKYRYLQSVEARRVMSINAYWGWIKPLNNKGLWQPGKEVLLNA